MICIIIGVLIVVIVAAVIVVLSAVRSMRNQGVKRDVYISGGMNPDTGRLCSDKSYFKYNGNTVSTVVVNGNYNQAASLSVTLYDVKKDNEYSLVINDFAIIGRKKDCSDLEICDSLVSKQHCMFSLYGGNLYISDLNSSNHTYLNGVIVTGEKQCKSGDIVKIGNTELKLRF